MTDPALAQWLGEHRAYLTGRAEHVRELIRGMDNHDEHALNVVLAERAAIAASAAEVCRHLEQLELGGTQLWLAYHVLVEDPREKWRGWYREGVVVLWEQAVARLEAAVGALDHPADRYGHLSHGREEGPDWSYYEYTSEHLLTALHQLREQLTALHGDPHNAQHHAAAQELLTELAGQTHHIATRLLAVVARDNAYLAGQHISYAVWAHEGLSSFQQMAHDFAAASLDHPGPLEEASWRATAALNAFLGR